MVQKVFSVYDSAVRTHKAIPFITTEDGLRWWYQAVNDDKLPFSKSPGYYTFFEIAQFDDATGRYEPYDAFVNHGTATEAQAKGVNQ